MDYSNVPNIVDQIQPAISVGYGLAGKILGDPCDRYRASSANNPLDSINHQDVIYTLFAFDAQFLLKKPKDYKSDQVFGSYDRTNTEIGDYLVNQSNSQIYFINSQESLTANGLISCNASLTFYRPTAQESGGYVGNGYSNTNLNQYGGNVDNLGRPLAANWPCSKLIGTKGEKAQLNIPDQARVPWWAIKMPLIPGITIQTNDLAIDQEGGRFLVSVVEISELGYNMTLDQVTI